MSYRDDPRWQAAMDDQIRDEDPGETSDELLIRRLRASLRLFDLETELGRFPVQRPTP